MRRLGAVGAAALLLLVTSLALPPRAAAVTVPLKSVSRYVQTVNHTTLYDWGCAMGTTAQQTFVPQNLVVVLDVGGPATVSGTYGATLFGGANQTIATIREAVKWYATGFYVCSDEGNTDKLRLAIGTNNSTGSAVTTAHGKAWGTMINALNAWAASNPAGQVVSFAGANDIEPGFGDPIPARNWVSGYDTNTNWSLYNFGSADGCSSTGIPGSECGTSGHPTWVAEDIWYVSWGAQPSYPLPEIYVNPPPGVAIQANQWYWLSKFSLANHGSAFVFVGAFTQYAADPDTNTAAQGYTQLYNKINSDAATAQTLKWSTDVTWGP